MKMKKILLIISLFTLLFAASSYMDFNKSTDKIEYSTTDSVLNENNVYLTLLAMEIKYPDIVMSQIMLESSHLTSRLCVKNNNLLGMTVPSKRPTMAINKIGYAKYNSWMDCIMDYKLYQDYVLSNFNINNKSKYVSFLQRNYAKSKDYKHNLLKLSKNYEIKNMNSGTL